MRAENAQTAWQRPKISAFGGGFRARSLSRQTIFGAYLRRACWRPVRSLGETGSSLAWSCTCRAHQRCLRKFESFSIHHPLPPILRNWASLGLSRHFRYLRGRSRRCSAFRREFSGETVSLGPSVSARGIDFRGRKFHASQRPVRTDSVTSSRVISVATFANRRSPSASLARSRQPVPRVSATRISKIVAFPARDAAHPIRSAGPSCGSDRSRAAGGSRRWP